MATMPIEIIVQDAEAPVVPSEDGTNNTETNITVPDTGTISSSGDTSSSASSIILPAILLVLAIGSIVAILIHKYHKQKKDKTSKKEKLAATASGTIAILAATVLVGNLVIPATSAATNVEPGAAELDTVDKITITATREIDSDITVVTVKNTSYATANLDFGYKVTASMAEGMTSANLYLDGDETSEYYIDPVTDGTLTDNTWGYTLSEDAEEYLSMALADSPAIIVKGNDAVENESVDIYYTIKADKSLPAGTYTGEVEYTIAPAVEYMQDFAKMTEAEKTATLANMPEGKQYILKDIRDKKPYYISKLADGNVWMTQNLDLDLSTEVILTPADTDVTENWTPMRSTISFTGTTVDGWQDDNYTPYSASPGDVYYYTSDTDADDIKYDSLKECEAEHSDGTCQHYHAGNYYSWSAAVASNDVFELIGDGSTVSSICPAGWRLPVNEGRGVDDVNEQKKVITAYDEIVGEWAGKPWEEYYNYQNGGFNSLRRNPIWLVRAGMITFTSGSLSSSGIRGYYWSSSYNAVGYRASGGDFNSNYIKPDGGNQWAAGYSVRCIAQ